MKYWTLDIVNVRQTWPDFPYWPSSLSGMWKMFVLFENSCKVRVYGGRQGQVFWKNNCSNYEVLHYNIVNWTYFISTESQLYAKNISVSWAVQAGEPENVMYGWCVKCRAKYQDKFQVIVILVWTSVHVYTVLYGLLSHKKYFLLKSCKACRKLS